MTEDSGWLAEWMTSIAADLAANLKMDGYDAMEAEAGKGPVVFVTVKGAAEDTTAAGALQPRVEGVLTAALKQEFKDWAEFRKNIRSYSKDGDLVMACEVVFP